MEKKRVIGLVAGRRNGNSEILVKEALMACEEAGLECMLINLFDYDIIPCSGCEGCTMQMGAIAQGTQKEYKGCIYKDKDDMENIDKWTPSAGTIASGVWTAPDGEKLSAITFTATGTTRINVITATYEKK